MVTGTTNLPDGTHLSVSLRKPLLPNWKERLAVGLTACRNDCLPLRASGKIFHVIVESGHFTDGPFTDKGDGLQPGVYVLEITSAAATDQPDQVRAIIGKRGENMTGQLVGGCCFAYRDQADIRKTEDAMHKIALLMGASVYYARPVKIGHHDRGNLPASNLPTQAYQTAGNHDE
jgi:hypothetical protein